MNKEQAEKQADDLIGMEFSVPSELTAPMQMKLANDLAGRLQKSNANRKIFWAGAAAVVLINLAGLSWYFTQNANQPEGVAAYENDIHNVADYYYSDHLNTY
jgi:lysozyme family protein